MAIAAVVIPLIETVVAPIVAPIVSSVMVDAGLGAATAAIATPIATQALLGAGGGALVGAATGQDVGKDALLGAVTGGIAAAAAPVVSSAAQEIGQAVSPVVQNVTGLTSDAAAKAATQTVGQAITGAEKAAVPAALTGQDVGKAAIGGAITGGATGALQNVVAPAVSGALGDFGKTTLAADTGATILGSTTVADVATGAVIGSGTAAAKAYASGGDVLKAAEAGAISGATSPLISGTVGEVLNIGAPTDEVGPQQPSALQSALQRGISTVGSSVLGGVAVGQRPEDAFKAAIPSGIGAATSGALQYGLGLQPSTAQALGQGVSAVSQFLTQPQGQQFPSASVYDISTPAAQQAPSTTGAVPTSSPQTVGGGGLTLTAPSSTLAQSLSIAPTLGYTPGGSVFGSSDTEGKKSNVWNVGSLRNVGSAEA